MGNWYIVVKTIKGRQYRYRQRTRREGKRVRTESYSLGPVDPAGGRETEPAKAEESRQPAEPTLAGLTMTVVTQLRDQRLAAAEWSEPFRTDAKAGPIKKIATLEQVLEACAPDLRHSRTDAAFYKYGSRADHINVPPQRYFVDGAGISRQYQYYHTLFHELAHWTRHQDRTGRVLRTGMVGRDLRKYAREELVAEAAAVIVMTRLGHPPPDIRQHVHYFRSWLNQAGNVGDALEHTMIEAESAAEFILSRVNTTKSGVL